MREFFARGMLKAFPHRQRQLEMAEAYQRVFGSPDGQKVLRDLLSWTGFLDIDTDLTGEDALYRCARRSVMAHVLGRLRWSASELEGLGEELTYEEMMNRETERDLERGLAA